jgi:hypothetical protein
MGWVSSINGSDEKHVQSLSRNHERKRQLGRHRRRWEVNIKMDKPIKEIMCECVNWIHLAQVRDQ